MLIELRKGMTLHPCTLNAVIAPEKVMISAKSSATFFLPSHHRFYLISLHIVYLYPKLLKFVNQMNR